jgi:16S rRNA processing protein RimM
VPDAAEAAGPSSPLRLVVGRLRRPHGLKGDCAVFPLTDHPEEVFAPGRSVWLKDLQGEVVAGPLEIERSRSYHRQWLVAFRGLNDRAAVEQWYDALLTVPAETLRPPEGDEVYLHELEGFSVQDPAGEPLGLVSGVMELPSGLMLEVQGRKREFLLPYRKEFVKQVDRSGRRLTVELPEGLID